MDFDIDSLIVDNSNGSHFSVLFEEKIDLENAVEALLPKLKSIYPKLDFGIYKNERAFFNLYSREYGPELVVSPLKRTPTQWYCVRENNMSFSQLQRLYEQFK